MSSTLGSKMGDDLEIGSRSVRIVGIVDDSTALAGQPNIFLTVDGAQQLGYSAQPIVTSIGIRGSPAQVPDGYRTIDRAGAVADLMRPMKSAVAAITLMAVLLWVVAALIVGSVIYLSALERTRDFAVLKAVGVSTRSVLLGLCLQAVIVAVVAAVLGGLLSLVLGPLFPMRVVVPTSAFLLLPVIGVVIGLLASVAGMRRAVTIDPALAFGGREPWAISINDLVVEYSSGGYAVRPIDGLNLEVKAGSLALLLGPSGCGKTTLLSCLGGILRPTSGRIALDGMDITKMDAGALTMYRRRTVGIVFQAFNLLASLPRSRT